MTKKNPHIGSSLDDFLQEQGLYEEATAKALKKVLAWQFAQAMKDGKVRKSTMVKRMGTSKSQLDRLLDPDNQSVTLKTISRAAAAVGKGVRIELIDQ